MELYTKYTKKGPDKNHTASMSKQESKIIKDTQEKMEVGKNGSQEKDLAEDFQVSHERMMELEFKLQNT